MVSEQPPIRGSIRGKFKHLDFIGIKFESDHSWESTVNNNVLRNIFLFSKSKIDDSSKIEYSRKIENSRNHQHPIFALWPCS